MRYSGKKGGNPLPLVSRGRKLLFLDTLTTFFVTDSGEISLLYFIDVSKCFDVISYDRFRKQQMYDINTTWFGVHLRGHAQSIELKGSAGRARTSDACGPNGSVPGFPLLPQYLRMISPFILRAHFVAQYATDTQIMVSGPKCE